MISKIIEKAIEKSNFSNQMQLFRELLNDMRNFRPEAISEAISYHYYFDIHFQTINYCVHIRSCCFKFNEFLNPNYLECIYGIKRRLIFNK
jgi:hypothetical protein